jgi:hypothetical protein
MKIYISSSWKNAALVRALAAELRFHGHEVFDFTDPACRSEPPLPPESFPEEFDPEKHFYSFYIRRGEWRRTVNENRKAIGAADLIILILPCGADAHADWGLGVGMGKRSVVVGCPRKGERSPVHLWADAILDHIGDVAEWVTKLEANRPAANEAATRSVEALADQTMTRFPRAGPAGRGLLPATAGSK